MTLAIYEDEDVTATRLNAWRQWQLGDGVKGQVRSIIFHEDLSMWRREQNRSDQYWKLNFVHSDVEHTERAITMMQKSDIQAWRALECYHLGAPKSSKLPRRCWGSNATGVIRRVCNAESNAEVPAILRRAHGLFRYCRAETAPMAGIENPSTRAPL